MRKQTEETLISKRTGRPLLRYLLHLPNGAEPGTSSIWPVIFFLHGNGERGNNLNKLLVYGIPKQVEDHPDFPFITVSPQCPGNDWWPEVLDSLNVLWEQTLERYPVDLNRVYLTGLSMGAYGSWAWAYRYPERFAAMAVISGGSPWKGFSEQVCALKDLPIWDFHGAKDDLVPISESEILVDALRGCQGNIRYTVYPEAGHDAWTPTYADPALYAWLLEHRRPSGGRDATDRLPR